IVLLLLAVVNAAIGVFYYLRVVVHMYFKTAEDEGGAIVLPLSFKVVLGTTVALTLLIGLYPDCIIGLL
ncbi:MAG: NADH-quinone oxidoreductase subunit N, partial [Sphingobacterium sp.]|nr:NADH-quinone oxidoreductase subunit N [Sphingobacterium sp.]